MLSLKLSKVLGVAFASAILAASASNAFAENRWQQSHPRRTEVNDRLANQNRRIDHKVRDGQMSRGEARRLHRDDRNIRTEERDMARADGGHITRADQVALNQQENWTSHQIYTH
jgi:hypothetical protein